MNYLLSLRTGRVINGESVSESEYEDYLKQVTSGKSVIINPPSESNDEYYAYHSPKNYGPNAENYKKARKFFSSLFYCKNT